MISTSILRPTVAAALLAALAPSQRDILSPFRAPDQDYAPPDAIYDALRKMRSIAEGVGKDACSFDPSGREVCDHPQWEQAFREFEKAMGQGYEGYLAQIMRRSRSPEDREIAFYGAFYGTNVGHVLNLIGHIPGEPERSIREQAFRRAVPFLQVYLGQKFGDLSDDAKAAIRRERPAVGSPAAKAQGITHDLTDDSWLFGLNVKPFVELMAQKDPLDRAQALWFFKELTRVRPDLVDTWLRPYANRLRTAAQSAADIERQQAFELIAGVDPEKRKAPSLGAPADEVMTWVDDVLEDVFPPIHRISSGLIQLYAGRQRDELVRVGTDLLRRGAMGRFEAERLPSGEWYRGLKIQQQPEPLNALGIPTGAVITAINGQGFSKEAELLDYLTKTIEKGVKSLLVEYVHAKKPMAVQIRIIR